MKKQTLFFLFLLLILTFALMGCGNSDRVETQQKTSGSLPESGEETQSTLDPAGSKSETENNTGEKTLNSQLLMEENDQEENPEYYVECRIEEEDRSTLYKNDVNGETSIEFYNTFLNDLGQKESLPEDVTYYRLDDARLYHRNPDTPYKIEFCTFVLIDSEKPGEETITLPVDGQPYTGTSGIFTTLPNRIYEISIEEYESLKSQIETDATAAGNETQVTWKEHGDAYYELTDDFPKGEIRIVKRYMNWAEGFQCSGYFVDEQGYIYNFDLSHHDFDAEKTTFDKESTEEVFMDALYYEVYYKNSPTGQVEEAYLNQMLDAMERVNPDSAWQEEPNGCDMGQNSLYTCSGFHMLKISTYGDYVGCLENDAAKELTELVSAIDENSRVVTED